MSFDSHKAVASGIAAAATDSTLLLQTAGISPRTSSGSIKSTSHTKGRTYEYVEFDYEDNKACEMKRSADAEKVRKVMKAILIVLSTLCLVGAFTCLIIFAATLTGPSSLWLAWGGAAVAAGLGALFFQELSSKYDFVTFHAQF